MGVPLKRNMHKNPPEKYFLKNNTGKQQRQSLFL